MQRDATTQKLLLGGAATLVTFSLLSARVVISLLVGAAAGVVGSLLLRPATAFEPVALPRPRASAGETVKPAPSGQTELALPEPLQKLTLDQPVERLAQLIIRDFVTLWYQRSVSLGDDRFPTEARHALNAFVNALSARLARCDTREAGVYILHSVSSALIAEMRAIDDAGDAERTPALDVGAAQRKVRAACEELLGGLAPRSAMASPAASALLSEVLTLVVWQVVTALDADWMNQTILAALNEAPAIEEKLAAAAEALPTTTNDDPFVVPPAPAVDSTPRQSLDAPSLSSRSASPSVLGPRAALKTCLDGSVVASEAALRRLAVDWPLDSLASPPSPPSDLVRALQGADDDVDRFAVRAYAFGVRVTAQSYIDSRPPAEAKRAQALLRLYGNIDSFVRHVQSVNGAVRLDILNLLQRVVDSVGVDDVREPLFDATLARCLLQLNQPDALEPMSRYLLSELAVDFWRPFRSPAAVAPSAPVPILPPRAQVTVTDVSDSPLAYDATGRLKSKRHLAFILAVERQAAPGFIVSRSWSELERADVALSKAFPQAGQSADFPRAMLPNVAAKSSDEITRALEAYLGTLLNDPRYAASAPVAQLFAQERTEAASAMSDNPLLDIGRGVGEGLAKTTTFATRGLSLGLGAMTSAVSAPFEAMSASPVLRKRASVQDVGTLAYTPRKVPVSTPAESTPVQPPRVGPIVESPVAVDQPAPAPPILEQPAVEVAATAASVQLSAADLDRVLAAGIAVIEEAYTASSAWSLRRGLIRLIEAVVRTSYSANIAVAWGSALAHANARTIARSVRSMTDAFWPGGTWYEPAPPRTERAKLETRDEARRLILALAPDGLKVALGGAATNAAIVRFHEAVASPHTQRWVAAVAIDVLRLLILV